MLSRSLLSQILLSFLALQASATQYCKCQNSQYGHTFGGIQHICKDLSNDWCSTNCDFFWGNCGYCQFKPAGEGPNVDYQSLKSWCFQQQDWDSASQRYFRGTEVNCYSYKNAQPKEFGNKGCEHEDNGDYARDRNAFLKIKLQGGWYQRRGCSNLMWTDWSELVKGFMRRNDDCQAINNNTIHYTIDCPYTAKDSDNEKRRVDFKSYCESLKGHWYQRHDGPDLLEALPDEEAVQQALAVPKRYPPKLPSSPKYDEDGAKVEWEWAPREPNEPPSALAPSRARRP